MKLFTRVLGTTAIVSLLAPPFAAPAVAFLSADALFDALTAVAGRSAPRISATIGADYPGLPGDLNRLVAERYPRLQSDLRDYLDRTYPQLTRDALRYLEQTHPPAYAAYQRELVAHKPALAAGRIGPGELFWALVERDPRLNMQLLAHLDARYPRIKFEVLRKIDRDYPALKLDLFKLIAARYSGFMWDVARIGAAEMMNEVRR